jgi:hypothetical protein
MMAETRVSGPDQELYTGPDEAQRFVKQTGINALAADNPHSCIVYAPQHTPTGAIVRASMLIYDVLSPEDMAGHEEFL